MAPIVISAKEDAPKRIDDFICFCFMVKLQLYKDRLIH